MIAVALKWVDLRPEIDPLTGQVTSDERWFGPSEADRAALEWALRVAEARQDEVTAITVGPAGADRMLREALACGAAHAVRVHAAEPVPSRTVATVLAKALVQAAVVVCGDYSADGGSGSVPAFLAHELGVAQALGLVHLEIGADEVVGTRRLDGGRRERLRLAGRSVLSVEGGTARLRRASLAAELSARTATVSVLPGPGPHHGAPPTTGPYRPRPRVAPAPPGATALERVRALVGADVEREPPQTVELDPPEAARVILDQLQRWGYLA